MTMKKLKMWKIELKKLIVLDLLEIIKDEFKNHKIFEMYIQFGDHIWRIHVYTYVYYTLMHQISLWIHNQNSESFLN